METFRRGCRANLASIFCCVYTETFLCLYETTKVLLWSDQNGDEQLSTDDGPDSEREGMKCEGEERDSEREGKGTDGKIEGWGDESEGTGACLDRRRGGTTTEGYTRVQSEESGQECRLGIRKKQVL